MKESTNREKVLKKIRDAIIDKSDNPFQNIDFESSVYQNIDDSLDIFFAEAFNESGGNFIYCSDEREFLSSFNYVVNQKKWENIFCIDHDLTELIELSRVKFFNDYHHLTQMKVGISKCEYLIARTGSVMVSSQQMSGRKLNFYPETLVFIAYTSQLIEDIKFALKQLRIKYANNLPSMISLITGPSRNLDIEYHPIIGSYGSKEIYVFLIDDNIQ